MPMLLSAAAGIIRQRNTRLPQIPRDRQHHKKRQNRQERYRTAEPLFLRIQL